jgi:hypothetical protein
MQTAGEYLTKTESAVRKLFEAIDSYTAVLTRAPQAVFVTSYVEGEEPYQLYEKWAKDNEVIIGESKRAQEEFLAEGFALATMCGAVLQVASKAIECFSANTSVPAAWSGAIGNTQSAVPFCIGKEIRTVPLGLVIYAARNQHTHFDDPKPHRVNSAVFEALALNHGYGGSFKDPAFDLSNPRITSLSSNVTALIKWRSYESYASDMKALLGI